VAGDRVDAYQLRVHFVQRRVDLSECGVDVLDGRVQVGDQRRASVIEVVDRLGGRVDRATKPQDRYAQDQYEHREGAGRDERRDFATGHVNPFHPGIGWPPGRVRIRGVADGS